MILKEIHKATNIIENNIELLAHSNKMKELKIKMIKYLCIMASIIPEGCNSTPAQIAHTVGGCRKRFENALRVGEYFLPIGKDLMVLVYEESKKYNKIKSDFLLGELFIIKEEFDNEKELFTNILRIKSKC